MTLLKAARTIKQPFSNEIEYYRVRYDFDKDGGAQAARTIFTLAANLLIVHAHVRVVTAGAGATATLIWGYSGDTDAFLNVTQGAVANLTAEACLLPPPVEGAPNILNVPIALASAETITMTTATANLTAGVFEFCIGVMKP